MSQARLAAAIAALAAVGFCREAYFHFWSEPHYERPIPGPPIDDEFRALRAALPRSGEVGYVTDQPLLKSPGFELQAATQQFLQMQYAIAPVILRYDDDRTPLVIANVGDESKLAEVLRAHRLDLTTQIGPRTALARPR